MNRSDADTSSTSSLRTHRAPHEHATNDRPNRSIKGTLPGTEPVRRKELVDMIEAPGSLRVTVEPLGLHETRVTVHEFDDDGTSQFLADAAGILTQEPNGTGYVFSMDP